MGWVSNFVRQIDENRARNTGTDQLIADTISAYRNNNDSSRGPKAHRLGAVNDYSIGSNELKKRKAANNKEIESINSLERNGLASSDDIAERKRLIAQNKKIDAVVNLGNKIANQAAAQATAPAQTPPPGEARMTTNTSNHSSPANTQETNSAANTQSPNSAANTQPADSNAPTQSPTENFAAANKSIQNFNDEARWAYMGTENSAEFDKLEETADKLNAAIANGASPKELRALAKSLNQQIDQLQAKLESEGDAGKAASAFLDKAGKSVDNLMKATNEVINSPESKLSDAMKEIPDSYKNTANYKELVALDKELKAAQLSGKDTKEIAKKINAAVDKWQGELSANPVDSKDAGAVKDRKQLEVALKNIEAEATNVIRSGNGAPVEKPDQITIDRKNNIINIDSNQDGKVDYQIKMEGKSSAWGVTKMGDDGKPEGSFRVWGDPHVDLSSEKSNGKNSTDFDFFDDATFVLKGVDGAPDIKITVDTKKKDGSEAVNYKDGDVSYAEGLTITVGDQALKVSGIKDNKVVIGDVSGDGQKIDSETNDGTVFIMGENLSDMEVESGSSSVKEGKRPMYGVRVVNYEYNENAYGDEEQEAA